MKLYHGTNKDFDRIDLLKSKPNKDFGRGFYLSADYEQALNMAQVKVEQLEIGSPIVQSYLIEDDVLNDLNVLRFEGYSEEWAKFILLNRNNPTEKPVHEYDVVIGPIANDRVGVQLWRYENRSIDLPDMNEKTEMMADMVKNLAVLLTEQNREMTMEEALATVFNSETYRKVIDERTHFYYQSYYYVFAFLKEELMKGKFE